MNACLYIGLGGTGLKILSRIKARLGKEGISNPKDVAFLGIDIGNADVPNNLNQNEIISLDQGAVDEIIKTDLYWNHIQDWWFTKDFSPKFNFSQGAWQLRLLGRLAFYYNGYELINRLDNVFQNLQGQGIEIFVISSTSGGTGAGLFRELPGLLKMVGNLNIRHNFYGFLINYDIVNNFNIGDNTSKERSKHNAVTLFSELDSIILNKNPLDISIRNQNNIGQPTKVNTAERYKWIFLQSYNNEDGSNMDTVNDYYELASLVLKHSYFISNTQITGIQGSWSGMENSIGQMLIGIEEPIKWGFKTKSEKFVQYDLPINKVKQYVGFGGFILEFPEGEVQEYLVNILLNDMFKELNNSSVEINEQNNPIDQIIKKIQESQNKDTLVNIAEAEIVNCANQISKHIFKATKNPLKENIKKHILNSESVETYINTLINDLNLVLSSLSGSFNVNLHTIQKDCIVDINTKIINNVSYNLKQKLILIDSLIDKIKFEAEDYSKTEVAWSKKIPENVAKSFLDNEITSFTNYLKNLSSFNKLFNKKEIDQAKDKYADNIAKSFVFTYCHTLLLNIINQPIVDLYYSLIILLQAEKQKIQTEIDKFGQYIRSVDFYFPDDLQNIITSSSEIDFHIKIAKSKSLLYKYIYLPQKNIACTDILINGVINFTSFDSLKNIIENNTRTILQGYTLDEAFRVEANYFLNDLPIVIDTGTKKGIVQFDNVIDFTEKSTQQEIAIFLGKYSVYYDRAYLQTVIEDLKTKTKNKSLLNNCIDNLINGRLLLIYNRWRSVFNTYVPIPFMNDPAQYIAYKIDNTSNPFITKFLNKSFIGIKNTLIPNSSKTRLDFVNFKVGFSLMQISQYLNGLRDQELNRIEKNFKYFNRKEFTNPDSSKIYHSDKRFSEQISLMNYSPLIFISDEKVGNLWKIILLFLMLEYVDRTEKKFSKILYDQDGQRIFDKDISFTEFNELYKLLFLFNEEDIKTLKIQLENELKSKTDKKDIVTKAVEYFKHNNLCRDLDQVITDYGNSIC